MTKVNRWSFLFDAHKNGKQQPILVRFHDSGRQNRAKSKVMLIADKVDQLF